MLNLRKWNLTVTFNFIIHPLKSMDCVNYINNGDRASYAKVMKEMLYGPLCHIEKAECTW